MKLTPHRFDDVPLHVAREAVQLHRFLTRNGARRPITRPNLREVDGHSAPGKPREQLSARCDAQLACAALAAYALERMHAVKFVRAVVRSRIQDFAAVLQLPRHHVGAERIHGRDAARNVTAGPVSTAPLACNRLCERAFRSRAQAARARAFPHHGSRQPHTFCLV